MIPQRFHALGTVVEAVQVPDELGAVIAIADWVRDNGGRTTDPLLTFGSVFRIHSDGASVPVHVGDWVFRYVTGGGWCVWADEKFTEAFKAVAS